MNSLTPNEKGIYSEMKSRQADGITQPYHSLYLHIPFCRHRCSYCDFNTYTTVAGLMHAYVESLCREIMLVGGAAENESGPLPVHTIYIGGGTPSLLSSDQLGMILDAAQRWLQLDSGAEISLEANPGTVSANYISSLVDLGINRLSLGVQSAIPSELKLLDREHDFADAAEAVRMSRSAGLHDLNLDLIYGVSGQTLSSWKRSLEAALALEPTHLSLYCLTIEPGTPMKRWLDGGKIAPPEPDLAAEQYMLACEMMDASGFEHYEISNWSLPGHACRHNLTYWRNQAYLGLGAGAHGQSSGYRYHVVKQPRVYVRRMGRAQPAPFPFSAATASKHLVSRAEAMSDTIITQLRLLQEGLNLQLFEKKFGQTVDDAYDGLVSQLGEWGLLTTEAHWLRLTDRGRFLSNQVFYRFME